MDGGWGEYVFGARCTEGGAYRCRGDEDVDVAGRARVGRGEWGCGSEWSKGGVSTDEGFLGGVVGRLFFAKEFGFEIGFGRGVCGGG